MAREMTTQEAVDYLQQRCDKLLEFVKYLDEKDSTLSKLLSESLDYRTDELKRKVKEMDEEIDWLKTRVTELEQARR